MFELTIKGRTKTFNTAAEMCEWRERMLTPSPRKKKHKKSKNKNTSE